MLDLPTLAYRRLRGDMIQVYKILHGLNDMDKDRLFIMRKNDKGTRGHKLKIQKQHAHQSIRRNSFTIRVVDHWNMLPESAVEAASVNIFKAKFDAFFSKKYNRFEF